MINRKKVLTVLEILPTVDVNKRWAKKRPRSWERKPRERNKKGVRRLWVKKSAGMTRKRMLKEGGRPKGKTNERTKWEEKTRCKKT